METPLNDPETSGSAGADIADSDSLAGPAALNAPPRRPKKGEILEVQIAHMDEKGRGIAPVPGADISVRHGIPGSKVRVRIGRGKSRKKPDGSLLETLDPGPHAVDARCPHAGVCGGCAQPRLAYEEQLRQKERIVRECIDSAFLQAEIPSPSSMVQSVVPAEKLSGYRNKMDFTFGSRRYILPGEPEGVEASFGLGLHAPGLYNKVLDIQHCDIAFEGASALVETARRVALEMGLDPWDLKTHTGLLRHLVVRRGERTGETMVNLVTSERAQERVDPYVAALLEAHPEITTLVQNTTTALATVAFGEHEYVHHGSGQIHDVISGKSFSISADSFFQTNTAQAERLFEIVEEEARLATGDVLFDLYCGAGTIGLVIGDGAGSVVGLESAPSSVRDARRNAETNGVAHASFVLGDVLAEIEAAGTRGPAPQVVVVDPPRAGLHPKVPAHVLSLQADRLVYVSCNPKSGSRDVAAFVQGGYRVRAIRPVDLFPHTPHVEVVFALERAE